MQVLGRKVFGRHAGMLGGQASRQAGRPKVPIHMKVPPMQMSIFRAQRVGQRGTQADRHEGRQADRLGKHAGGQACLRICLDRL